MANTFKLKTKANVGISTQNVYVVPSATTTVVIGITLANTSGSGCIVGVGITAVYILRLLSRVFMGPLPDRWDDQTDANVREKLAASLLSFFILVIELWPFYILKVIEMGIAPLVERLG